MRAALIPQPQRSRPCAANTAPRRAALDQTYDQPPCRSHSSPTRMPRLPSTTGFLATRRHSPRTTSFDSSANTLTRSGSDTAVCSWSSTSRSTSWSRSNTSFLSTRRQPRQPRQARQRHQLGRTLTSAAHHGVKIDLFCSCMDADGINTEMLVPNAHKSTLEQVSNWTLWADTTLAF